MDLSFNAEERAFQDEVRGFIARNLTEEMKRATALTPSVFSDPDIGMAWQRTLHKQGWGAPGWPVEYGAPGWTPAQRWIFEAECARAGTPNVNVMGVKMVGPVIIGFGSPEQKNYYLPKILSGEDYWCQGYSEPGSGSDLASLKTRAVATATTISSMVQKSGPRMRITPTACSRWCAPTTPSANRTGLASS